MKIKHDHKEKNVEVFLQQAVESRRVVRICKLSGSQPQKPAGRTLPTERFLVPTSVRDLFDPQGHSAVGRIRSIEKSDDPTKHV
jgi:hypothetical protein